MSTFDGVFHHNMSWMRLEVCKLYHLFPTDAAEVYKIRMNANLCALPQRVVLKCGRLCLVTLSSCWLNWFPWLLTWSFPREVVAPRICFGVTQWYSRCYLFWKWWSQRGIFQQTPNMFGRKAVSYSASLVFYFSPELISHTHQYDRSSTGGLLGGFSECWNRNIWTSHCSKHECDLLDVVSFVFRKPAANIEHLRMVACDAMCFSVFTYPIASYSIHVWYIYLRLPYKSTKCR